MNTPAADCAFSLEGELTIRTASMVHEQLQNALEEGFFALDLSKVEAMDSAGFQLLVAADRSLRKSGLALQIHQASTPVTDLLSLYGRTDYLHSASTAP